MNTKINEVMRDRDYHHRKAIRSNSSFHWAQYRRLKNLANRDIKSAKSNYYCEVIKEAKGGLQQDMESCKRSLLS